MGKAAELEWVHSQGLICIVIIYMNGCVNRLGAPLPAGSKTCFWSRSCVHFLCTWLFCAGHQIELCHVMSHHRQDRPQCNLTQCICLHCRESENHGNWGTVSLRPTHSVSLSRKVQALIFVPLAWLFVGMVGLSPGYKTMHCAYLQHLKNNKLSTTSSEWKLQCSL